MYEDIIAEIKNKLLLLNEDRQELLHWVRGYVNVRGNEVVITLAKKGTRDIVIELLFDKTRNDKRRNEFLSYK